MVESTQWDVTEYLDSEEAIAAYLDAVAEGGNLELIETALEDVARVRQRRYR